MFNENTILMIHGKKVSMDKFQESYGIDTMDRAIELAEIMVKKGRATVYSKTSEEDAIIEMLEKEEEFSNLLDAIDEEESAHEQYVRAKRAEDVDLTSIRLSFKNSADASKAEYWVNGLGINDTEISIKNGQVALVVRDITPIEYAKIARRYQADKVIGNTVDLASKTVTSTTDALNYGLTNIVAPTAKIAGQAGMNIGKGVIHTGMKVGAGLVNSGSKAIEETKVAMTTDLEVLRAKKELVDAKDKTLSFFRRKMNSAKKRSGIEEF